MKIPAATSELAAMTTISSEGIFLVQVLTLDQKFTVGGEGKPKKLEGDTFLLWLQLDDNDASSGSDRLSKLNDTNFKHFLDWGEK